MNNLHLQTIIHEEALITINKYELIHTYIHANTQIHIHINKTLKMYLKHRNFIICERRAKKLFHEKKKKTKT